MRSELVEAKRGAPKLRRATVHALLAQARRADDPLGALRAIADEQGYKPGWAYHIARVWGITG